MGHGLHCGQRMKWFSDNLKNTLKQIISYRVNQYECLRGPVNSFYAGFDHRWVVTNILLRRCLFSFFIMGQNLLSKGRQIPYLDTQRYNQHWY